MGLCSDTNWKRLQERRAARAEADAATRADRARMTERLSGLSAAYEERTAGRDGRTDEPVAEGGTPG